MKISKKDALMWFRFFAALPPGEELPPKQQEIAYSVLTQIERAIQARDKAALSEIQGLKSLDGRTFYVGPDSKFPKGCRGCLTGSGLAAVRKTNRCNIVCPFCYNYGELDCQPPIGEGMWEIGGTRYYEEDMDLLLSVQDKPTGVAYVYLEPFMEIGEYYGIISRFRKAGVYQHLYTNGTLCTKENLKALGNAGLDELRFNLGATACADRVIDSIADAKKYIPAVGIETPMTPGFLEAFRKKKQKILDTGIDFINCAELHLNPNNIVNYETEPVYMSRRGYISPIWSHAITLQIMAAADAEKWDVAVHDCSNRTKFARDLNLKAKEGAWFGASDYACEFPEIPYGAFLPTLETDNLPFVEEEPLPPGYRPGDIVL